MMGKAMGRGRVEKDDTPSIKYAALPLISDKLPIQQFKLARDLLIELDGVEEMLAAAEARSEKLKALLQDIQCAAKLPGLRLGGLCYAAQEHAGRRTLSKELLMKNGVKAAVIARSFATGEPYVTRTFKNLEEVEGGGKKRGRTEGESR